MNYYNEIKNELVNNEVYKRVKDYSKNRSDLQTYYNVGKLLSEAGKHYGEGIIKEYSKKLMKDLNKCYTKSSLYNMRNFYCFIAKSNFQTVFGNLTWSHYLELLKLSDNNMINYYLQIVKEQNLSVRQLREKIKNNDYERLSEETKNKLITNEEKLEINDLVKDPIVIKNTGNYEVVSEMILQNLILEDIESFMKELGSGFCFIGSEYKIKIGNTYNYIDLLLYNIEFNCYVVVELKVTELKKEHIGQIEVYMNYIDENVKNVYQDKTIGIIICKENNSYYIKYSSDKRIFKTEYVLN